MDKGTGGFGVLCGIIGIFFAGILFGILAIVLGILDSDTTAGKWAIGLGIFDIVTILFIIGTYF